MKPRRNRQEFPLIAYVVITITFIMGTVAANVFGQPPHNVENSSGSHAKQRLLAGHDHDHVRRRWLLGVRADATEAGFLIRHVEPHSAASRLGLEAGDRIVTIDGIQIGLIGHLTVRLGDTLERQGGHDGRVRLLVQNRRNRRLVSLKVALLHPTHHLGH